MRYTFLNRKKIFKSTNKFKNIILSINSGGFGPTAGLVPRKLDSLPILKRTSISLRMNFKRKNQKFTTHCTRRYKLKASLKSDTILKAYMSTLTKILISLSLNINSAWG
jgi:hypothetical protein